MIVRKLKYVLVIAIIWMFPNIVHADCSYERMAELSRIASNVQFSYEYEIKDGVPNFQVNITNVTNDIYIADNKNNIFAAKNEFSMNYLYISKIVYDIYSNDDNCKGEKISTSYVNFPYYNYYAALPECSEYPAFKLCVLWSDTTSYSTAEFYEELEKYKSSIQPEEKITTETGLFEMIKNTFTDSQNIIYLIVSAIAILLLIIIFVFKRVKK